MAAWMKGHCFFTLPNNKARTYLEDALLRPVLAQRDAKIATHGTQESYHTEPCSWKHSLYEMVKGRF